MSMNKLYQVLARVFASIEVGPHLACEAAEGG